MNGRTAPYLGLAGIVGPVVFLVTMTALGFAREGYSQVEEFGSELGASGTDLAWIMVVKFIFAGAMLVALGVGLFRVPEFGRGARTGAVFVMLLGLGIVFAGVFQSDPCCPEELTAEGVGHVLASLIGLLSGVIAMFVFAKALPKTDHWRALRRPSLVWGVLSFALLALTVAAGEPGTESGPLAGLTGAFQRAFLVSLFAWTATMGYKLYRRESESIPSASVASG